MKTYKLKDLSNGISIFVDPVDTIDMVSVVVGVNVGSRFESKEEEGLAHFVEHMMFDGTTNRTAEEIFKQINSVGGQINAYTSKSMTMYYAKVRSEHFELALDVLSDMIKNSTFPEEEIEKEKGVITEEIMMSRSNDRRMASDLLNRSVYRDHPLGHSILGTEENIESVTRDKIKSFVDKYYTGSNIVVVASGNIDNELKAQELMEKYFTDIPRGEGRIDPKRVYEYDMHLLYDKSSWAYNDTPQAQLMIFFNAKSSALDTKKMTAGQLLGLYLAGTMNSPLTKEIREERGLAYSVSSHAAYGFDHGSFHIDVATQIKNVDEVIEIIKEELTKIVRNGLDEEIFNIAVNMYRSYAMENFETIENRAHHFANNLIVYTEPYYYDEIRKEIDSITIEYMNDLAKKIFRRCNTHTVVYGRVPGDA